MYLTSQALALDSREVHNRSQHKINRGDLIVDKYDETLKFGNTTVHIVYPKDITPEKQQKALKELNAAAWRIIKEILEKHGPEKTDEILAKSKHFN